MAICSILGCSTFKTPKVILLPEERIFTIPGGQAIKVYLDHKEMTMTFPEDMKLVSPTVLVRQEEKLNNATLNKIKAEASKGKTLGIVASILTAIAMALGIFFKTKKWIPNIKANVEVK